MLFLIRIAETIFHMRSKLRRNYAIKCVYFLRFQQRYICPNPCIIDDAVITTHIFTGIVPVGSCQRYWWLSNTDSSFLDVSPSARTFSFSLAPIWVILDQKYDFH